MPSLASWFRKMTESSQEKVVLLSVLGVRVKAAAGRTAVCFFFSKILGILSLIFFLFFNWNTGSNVMIPSSAEARQTFHSTLLINKRHLNVTHDDLAASDGFGTH